MLHAVSQAGHAGVAFLSLPNTADKRGTIPQRAVRRISVLLFARRLALVIALLFVAVAPAWATPMLLVDRSDLQVLYAEEAGQPWHPASLTKLMTAYVVFEELAKGTVTLQTPVRISRNAWNQAPSKSGLAIDSALSLEDALYVLVVKSANDIAVALAET
ncbi:MAG: D-alanyl-D-alanine carboxypeptidase, partial [Oxalobacteraceae bacterium]